MYYRVVSKINISKNAKRIGEFRYEPDMDGLSLTAKYPFPVQLRISHGLNMVEVTPMFLKLPFILRGWINLDVVMREIDVMKLALKDKLLLHASCVDDTLYVGFPNSGKTYATYGAVSRGGKFISEEYTIIEKGVARPYRNKAKSCLSARTVKDCNMKLTAKERVGLAWRTARASLIPYMFEAAIWKSMPLSGESAKVKRIVYGSTGREVKDHREMIILTDNEFPFGSEYFMQAYALASGFDLLAVQKKHREVIREFVEGVYGKV